MTVTSSRERGRPAMEAQQRQTAVPPGTWTPVVPSQGFACVEDDLFFTGSASLCKEPYFSQLENFEYGRLIGRRLTCRALCVSGTCSSSSPRRTSTRAMAS